MAGLSKCKEGYRRLEIELRGEASGRICAESHSGAEFFSPGATAEALLRVTSTYISVPN